MVMGEGVVGVEAADSGAPSKGAGLLVLVGM